MKSFAFNEIVLSNVLGSLAISKSCPFRDHDSRICDSPPPPPPCMFEYIFSGQRTRGRFNEHILSTLLVTSDEPRQSEYLGTTRFPHGISRSRTVAVSREIT